MSAVVRFAGRLLRVARAVWRFARAHSPRWLLPVLAVCVFVPGPFDELAVLAVVLVPVLRSREARRELGSAVAGAWRSLRFRYAAGFAPSRAVAVRAGHTC